MIVLYILAFVVAASLLAAVVTALLYYLTLGILAVVWRLKDRRGR